MSVSCDLAGVAPVVEQVVTPWQVTSTHGFNYTKLVQQFGCAAIDGEMIKRFEKVTKRRAHTWLRRGLFFAHRDIQLCLDAYERGEEIYLYTGRGPTSEAMHLGHMIPFEFTRYLQDAFDAILVIQMSDDEKLYFKHSYPLEYYQRLSRENAKDIIARGFNPAKTYIFSNTEEVGGALQKNVVRMMANTAGKTIKAIFGLEQDQCSIGQLAWPIYQSVPAFSTSFPKIFGARSVRCLVPMAIDQDPYFRLARDYARAEGILRPSAIHSEFLVGLSGIGSKMSSSEATPTIFLTDTPAQIKEKVTKYAFSGGGVSRKEHMEKGGNLVVDVAYQYLLYFLDDDVELQRIAEEYSSGRMMTSEIKQIMVHCVSSFIAHHQVARQNVDDTVLQLFFDADRAFDHAQSSRDAIVLLADEAYARMGVNFDRYFDCVKT